MYVARDSDGTLSVFAREPQRTCFNDDSKEGWWYSDYDEGIQLDKEDDCYPDLKWEDDPIKVMPMAVTKDNELKDWWMAAPSAQFVRAFVDQESAEDFAQNNFKDIGLKVFHCTHE